MEELILLLGLCYNDKTTSCF